MNKNSIFDKFLVFLGIFFLTGCHRFIFYPSGIIAIQQYKLIFLIFLVMLVIVLPVFILTFFFVYSYRRSKNNTYRPNWSHSYFIECMVWIIPILIIVFFSFITWNTSHSLDPKKKIVSNNSIVKIHVVALDWQWLFIYPKEKIATLNELVIPNNTPIKFIITSNSVMSSFFIPNLGSQIYAMPGMKTILNLLSTLPGKYCGFSSNYNGEGFSDMKFNTIVVPNDTFITWVNKVHTAPDTLKNINDFNILAKPNILHQIRYFSFVYDSIFDNILNNNL
ncbi:ubiquinol oxidase subunit II [Buchnera aphidicola]|uniref:ubiquinol oxidase subunit II n=1 Tax=Buchnera aphidicola TaxID=9 RepID=UPI003463F323